MFYARTTFVDTRLQGLNMHWIPQLRSIDETYGRRRHAPGCRMAGGCGEGVVASVMKIGD
ncbi:hypothetical protein B0J17DRAFT_676424 [Rhizoctonia solani]|nr:hypothetical protein B0J17DRAFT_676424 [Rhizoctonia solani]